MYIIDVNQALDPYADNQYELYESANLMSNFDRVNLFEEKAKSVLDEIEGRYRLKGVQLSTVIIVGGIPENILDSANKYNTLAIGRRGTRHQKDSHHLGSNFREIAHHIRIPLIIGGEGNHTGRKYRHVLLAYDGTETSVKALNWLERLQSNFSEIDIISVSDDPFWRTDRLDEVNHRKIKYSRFKSVAGDPASEILLAVDELDIDLLMMGSYRHSQLIEWIDGSILDTVLRHTGVSIFAAR